MRSGGRTESRAQLGATGTVPIIMCRSTTIVLSLAIVIGACTSNPTTDPADESTTGPSGETSPTTTEVTLPPAEDVERGVVDGVIDGDTIQAVVDGQRVEIRLIGVDAPEAADCYGGDSRTALSSLVTGQTVALASDGAEVDSSGRWLRYAIIESTPPVLVNAELVSDGAVIPVHSGHAQQDDFMARGDRAYASGKGLWGTFVCGHSDDGVSPDRPQLRVSEVNLAPAGTSEVDLTEEWFQIVNQSYTVVDISGWLVRNETGERFFDFPAGTAVAAGSSLRVTTGCGNSTGDVLYWCSETPVWSISDNTVILRDQLGNVVDRRTYETE
jgi:endonuclease YncB( thermonuclease family)